MYGQNQRRTSLRCPNSKIEMKKIALGMIVKNEAHVITRCLNSVKNLIDYILIIDTGSSDNTLSVIYKWMHENKIQGQILLEEWKDFATNRTSVLTEIRKLKEIDYVLMIDADEVLIFEDGFDPIKFKQNLKDDIYNITTNYGATEYSRPQICSNTKPFIYRGIVHEFLDCQEPISSRGKALGFFNMPMQDSARNQSGIKFQKDAELLRNALLTEKDEFLISRYCFYLAQSLRDARKDGEAIKYYEQRLNLKFWEQERFWAAYQIAKLKENLKHPLDDIIQSYLRAYEICPERIESLHGAIRLCRLNGRNHQGYILGKHALSLPKVHDGLFIEKWIYDYGLLDEYSIAAYWAGYYGQSRDACLRILKCPQLPDSYKNRIQQNLQFALDKLK